MTIELERDVKERGKREKEREREREREREQVNVMIKTKKTLKSIYGQFMLGTAHVKYNNIQYQPWTWNFKRASSIVAEALKY